MVECLYYITIFGKRFTCLLLSFYLFIWFECFIGCYLFSNIIYLGFWNFIFACTVFLFLQISFTVTYLYVTMHYTYFYLLIFLGVVNGLCTNIPTCAIKTIGLILTPPLMTSLLMLRLRWKWELPLRRNNNSNSNNQTHNDNAMILCHLCGIVGTRNAQHIEKGSKRTQRGPNSHWTGSSFTTAKPCLRVWKEVTSHHCHSKVSGWISSHLKLFVFWERTIENAFCDVEVHH